MKGYILKALIFSFFLHLFLLILFNVEISKLSISDDSVKEVTFIGSILPTLSPAQIMKSDFYDLSHVHDFSKVKTFPLDIINPLIDNNDIIYSGLLSKGYFDVLEGKIVNQVSAGFDFVLPGHIYSKSLLDFSDSVLEGSLKNRAIVIKPDIGEIEYLSIYSSYISAQFGIEVDSNGRIQKIYILKTTGDPTIDIALQRYIKGWVFEPAEHAKMEEGKINFNLNQLIR